MAKLNPTLSKHVTEWDEGDVHVWMASLGYPQYDRALREHKIQGDALCMMDPVGLQALGVASAGQRLTILRAIYNLKLEHGIPFDEDSYVPPSESSSEQRRPVIEELKSTVNDQGRRLLTLEEENRALATAMSTFAKEIVKLRSSLKLNDGPISAAHDPRATSQDLSRSTSKTHLEVPERSQTPSSDLGSSSSNALPTPSSSASDLGYGSKISLNDPTWKVLPAALKKHGISDDPNEYVMFISYGTSEGSRTKRRLELEEKPLYLFKKLKEAKQKPAFLLKKVKDIRYRYGVDVTTTPTGAGQVVWASDAIQSNILPTPPMS